MYIWLYIALYTHIFLHICTQKVRTTHSQRIHTQEAGAHYTSLTQIQCRTTQFLYKGLQHQPSYPDMW